MRVLKASWEITRRCNANCAHCYVDGSHNMGELDDQDIEVVLQRLIEGGVRYLTFVGGEPCVAQNYGHAITHAIKLGFICKTITNGTIKSQQLIEHNRNGRLGVVLSILAGTGNAFKKAYGLSTIIFQNQRHLLTVLRRYSINITLFSENTDTDTADEIAMYLAPFSEKIGDVSVLLATPNGRELVAGCGEIRNVQQKLSRQLIGRLADYGILADVNVGCVEAGLCPLIDANVPGEIFLNPLAHIRPCHALVGYETHESLLDATLSELLESPAMQRWKGTDKRFAFDRRCKATLMQSQIHTRYVEESGGSEAFKKIEIHVSPDMVLDKVNGTWYAYLRTTPSLLELNEDAYDLMTSIQRGEWRGLAKELDDEELSAVVKVVLEAEAAGFLTLERLAIRSGPLPNRALSDSAR